MSTTFINYGIYFGLITYTLGTTLYSFDSPIVQLDATNFTQHVANSETAWMIEFYATWCGHCQRFAPDWLAFAEDVKGQFNFRSDSRSTGFENKVHTTELWI